MNKISKGKIVNNKNTIYKNNNININSSTDADSKISISSTNNNNNNVDQSTDRSTNQMMCLSLLYDPNFSGSKRDIYAYEREKMECLKSLTRLREIRNIHLDVKHNKVYPIALTFTHAFVLSNENKESNFNFNLHALKIYNKEEPLTPHSCHRQRKQYCSPWTTFPEKIPDFICFTAFLGNVCIVSKSQLLVLDVSKNWVPSYQAKEDFSLVTHIAMNKVNLAYIRYNKEKGESMVYLVHQFKKTVCFKVNDEITALEVPEELSSFAIYNIFISCKKTNRTSILQFNPKSQKIQKQQDEFQPWPFQDELSTRLCISTPTTFIRYRYGNMSQVSYDNIVIYYNGEKLQDSLLKFKSYIVNVEFVGSGYSIVHTIDHSIFICSANDGVVFSITNQETCKFGNLASERTGGITFAQYPYKSIRMFSNKLVCMLSNGTIVFIDSGNYFVDMFSSISLNAENKRISKANISSSSSSSSSASSNNVVNNSNYRSCGIVSDNFLLRSKKKFK